MFLAGLINQAAILPACMKNNYIACTASLGWRGEWITDNIANQNSVKVSDLPALFFIDLVASLAGLFLLVALQYGMDRPRSFFVSYIYRDGIETI